MSSSVRKQKNECENGVRNKQSTAYFPKKEQFLLPDTHKCEHVFVSKGKKCSFFRDFGVLCFLVHT